MMNTATTIIPQARLLSGVVSTATGSNLYVGQVGIEAEFVDAHSNERLAAVAAKQAGKKYVPFTDRKFDPTSTWGQVEQAMDYWAKKLRPGRSDPWESRCSGREAVVVHSCQD